MRDEHLLWYFFAICGTLLGGGLLSSGLRNPHARINVLFGLALLGSAAVYACRGYRIKRNAAGTAETDETTVNNKGGQSNE